MHGPRGIHAQQLNSGAWQHTLEDGLGSVRAVVDNNLATLNQANYSAYGTPDAAIGSPFAFTGEQRDGNGLQYHRARYYNPSLGIFLSLDPFEGMAGRPMSLNGYSWVEGNVVNAGDPSGMQTDNISLYPSCSFTVDALSSATLDGFIQRNLDLAALRPDLFGFVGEGRDNAIRLLVSQFSRCRRELYSRPSYLWGLEYNLRLMVNGYNLRDRNDPISMCPSLASIVGCDDPQSRLIMQGISADVLRQCLPLGLSDGTSLENSLGAVQPSTSLPFPNQGTTFRFTPCVAIDAAKVRTTGVIYSAGFYVALGGGLSYVEAQDISGREMHFFSPSLGVGLGGKGGSAILFVSEQSLSDFAGLGFNGELDLLIVGVSASFNPAASDVCGGTTAGAGVAIGLGASLTISYSFLVYDSDAG